MFDINLLVIISAEKLLGLVFTKKKKGSGEEKKVKLHHIHVINIRVSIHTPIHITIFIILSNILRRFSQPTMFFNYNRIRSISRTKRSITSNSLLFIISKTIFLCFTNGKCQQLFAWVLNK